MKKKFIAKLLVLAMVAAAALPVAITAANAYYGEYSVTNDTAAVSNESVKGATVEAKVTDGIGSLTLDAKAVAALAAQSNTWVIEAKGATQVNFSVPTKAMVAAAEKLSGDLTMKFGDVATITIPKDSLTAEEFGADGNVDISVKKDGVNHFWSIYSNGKSLDKLKGLVIDFGD